jgi:hypothetical protein
MTLPRITAALFAAAIIVGIVEPERGLVCAVLFVGCVISETILHSSSKG